MKKPNLDELTPQQALKIAQYLFYGGLAMVLLMLFIGVIFDSVALMAVLGIIGLACMFGGGIFGNIYIRCPKCRGSLMPGGRLPGSLSTYCPHCGMRIP
ncbi:MAG: hypothetical protein E7429_05230 [Ruminococcaceae bacterium]|nr:hypothetical protein [Oscillospiraceae bacterium]